jgi:hypothetical protein
LLSGPVGLQPYTAAQQAAKAQRVPHSTWDNRAMAWVDARPLEALRAGRWALIKGARTAAMDAPIDTAFGVFDADPASRSALVEALALSGSGRALVRWTTADNQVVPLSLEELASVALQIAQRTEQCHAHAQRPRANSKPSAGNPARQRQARAGACTTQRRPRWTCEPHSTWPWPWWPSWAAGSSR